MFVGELFGPGLWLLVDLLVFQLDPALPLEAIFKGVGDLDRGIVFPVLPGARVGHPGGVQGVPDVTAWLPTTLWWGVAGYDPWPTLQGSVASSLLDLRAHLIERFPWDRSEALMYVLTATVPWIEPLSALLPEGSPDQYEMVNIAVWPWVPVEDVARLYNRVRHELVPTSVTSPRRLALFKFVMQHPGVRVLHEGHMPEIPTWRKLFGEWNEQHPQGDKYHYSDLRNFQKSVRVAFDQIVNFYPSDTWYSKVQSERDRLDRTGDGSMATIRARGRL